MPFLPSPLPPAAPFLFPFIPSHLALSVCVCAWVMHEYPRVPINVRGELARVDFFSFNVCPHDCTQVVSLGGQNLYYRATPLVMNFNFMNNILFRNKSLC